jgi:hypothetical protein
MEKENPGSPRSYVLRITREEWYRQVFSIKKYFPGVPRRWDAGGTIFLVRKAEKGDSLIGYGVIGGFVKKDLLPESRRKECEKMGWKGAIEFSELYRIEPPVPVKETALAAVGVSGSYLHGYVLTKKQADSILKTIKEKAALKKVE